jgi:glycosyltransferase involved in cell wall biosynthesis
MAAFAGAHRTIAPSAKVHFLDDRGDVPQLMRAADLFVFPSRYEAFPLVLLEAMASGLPIVTIATAGAADLAGAECGVVVDDPNDVSAFAVALRGLVPYPEKRKRIG